jgi:hypothetical protein
VGSARGLCDSVQLLLIMMFYKNPVHPVILSEKIVYIGKKREELKGSGLFFLT